MRVLASFALGILLGVSSEEQSILTDNVTLGQFDISVPHNHNERSLIDNGFKTMWVTTGT